MGATATSTANAIAAYLKELEGARRSAQTIRNYRHQLMPLARRAPRLPCSADAVRLALDDRSQGAYSRKQQLAAIRRFLRWTGTGDPTEAWPDITARAEVPRVFSDSEIDTVVSTAKTNRDRLLVLVLLDTGIRVGEMSGMRPSDLEGRWLRVDGKTGPRRVPISEWVAMDLMELADGHAVFWQARGRPGVPMPTESLKKTIVRILKNAGITGRRVGAHTFRHSMATRFVEDGGDVAALQQILGHASITQTMQYVSLAGNHSLKEHAEHSPARRFAPDRSKLPTLPPASGITTVTDDGVVLAPADYGEPRRGRSVRPVRMYAGRGFGVLGRFPCRLPEGTR